MNQLNGVKASWLFLVFGDRVGNEGAGEVPGFFIKDSKVSGGPGGECGSASVTDCKISNGWIIFPASKILSQAISLPGFNQNMGKLTPPGLPGASNGRSSQEDKEYICLQFLELMELP